MKEFLETPLVYTLGWIIGIASGIIQLISYFQQKNIEKGYLNVLEQAKRDWEGKYTEDQIAILAKELKELETRINTEVPRQARQVFLENQLLDLSQDIGRNYAFYQQLTEEYEGQIQNDALTQELKRAVEQMILPDYLAHKRDSARSQWLLATVLIMLILFNWEKLFSFFPADWSFRTMFDSTPYPVSWLLIYALIVLTFCMMISRSKLDKWIKSHSNKTRMILKKNPSNLKEEIIVGLIASFAFLFALSIIFLPPYTFIMSTASTVPLNRVMPLSLIPLAICFALPLAFTLLFIFYLFFPRNFHFSNIIPGVIERANTRSDG